MVARGHPTRLTGIITRSGVLAANARRLHEMRHVSRQLRVRQMLRRMLGNREKAA